MITDALEVINATGVTEEYFLGFGWGWRMEAPVGIEPTIAELQSTALPLCYGALKLSLYYFLYFFID
tara:strand:+ start:51 stop:251 length:201 start_codon:yes stop_codon:yes gene_type:complete